MAEEMLLCGCRGVIQVRHCVCQKELLGSVQERESSKSYLPLSPGKVLFNLGTDPILDILVGSSIARNPRKGASASGSEGVEAFMEIAQPSSLMIQRLPGRSSGLGPSSGHPQPLLKASRMGATRCKEDRGQGKPGLSFCPPWALLTTHGRWPLLR